MKLLLLLVFGLAVAKIVDVRVLSSQVVDLLLEDVINLFLVHLLLLLGSEADATRKLLHLSLDALGDGLTRLVSQESHHLPATEMQLVQGILGVAKLVQLLLDVVLRELAEVSLSTSDGLGVLDGWVQEHAVDLSLVE